MASSNVLWPFIYWIIWASVLIIGVHSHNSSAALPIFPLHPEPIGKHRAIELIKALYNVTHYNVKEVGTRVIVTSDHHILEVDTVHGGIWSADESKLWNHELRPHLVDRKRGLEIANKLIDTHQLFPNHTASPLRLKFHDVSGTRLAVLDNYNRTDYSLDTRLIYTTTVDVSGYPGFPVVGGGGAYQIVLGENGCLIAFYGVSPKAVSAPFYAKVIPQKDADETFLQLMKDVKLEKYNSSLAYYMAPSFTKQEFLYPVYVYQATAIIGNEKVQLRAVTLPATDFGPHITIPKALPTTTRPTQPQPSKTESHDERSIFSKRSSGGDGTKEFGTSWIGLSGGLPGSQANALGFETELLADGWQKGFNWGDAAAFESDWNENDDSYVDAVDFVFYTGHANGNGWQLSPPSDNFLSLSDVEGAPDRWGKQDCEWIVIAACGPLQDDIINGPGGGDVFRWRPAFDGLHMLLGYATTSYDNTDEGRILVQNAKAGGTIKSSWFRAASDTQPAGSGIWAGALWGVSHGADPGNDHIWGHGSVSPDPKSPTTWIAMWLPI